MGATDRSKWRAAPIGRSVAACWGVLPNKRLKLPGALVGGIALPRQRAFLSAAPPPCAGGALRPQLKRDPLGGALPPHKHPSVKCH